MNKKILAVTIALLMTLSVVSVIQPAKAQSPNAIASGLSLFLRPGIEDLSNPGWSHTLGTLRNTPDWVTQYWLDYAILASTDTSPSIGDLQFDFTFTSMYIGALYIYLPPDFVFLNPDGTENTDQLQYNVWTDATNDYWFVAVSTRGAWDAVAPFWHRVRVGYGPDNTSPGLDNGSNGSVFDPGTYHVRIFNVKAPTVAGVYHFKIGLYDYATQGIEMLSPNWWPIIIVKSEVNAAYVEGSVGLCADLPCSTGMDTKSGKVWAEGTTPEGRTVSAQYYFSPDDYDATDTTYKYWLFGVAPGTYTLYASAGGFPKVTGERFTVVAGQSQHLKTQWLTGGPWLTVTVWSKHGRGELPWGSLYQPPYGTNDPTVLDLGRPRQITIDLFEADSGNQLLWGVPTNLDPLSSSYTVTFSPDISFTAMVPLAPGGSIDGFTGGVKYRVEAYVTGYIMVDEDLWQREFTMGGNDMQVQMDLRRTNWFAISVHMTSSQLPTVPTTMVLAAVDKDGNEKGVTSVLIDTNGDILFWDSPTTLGTLGPQINPATGTPYNVLNPDPIILEGWSHRYLLTSSDDNAAWRDYGLVPGTYDIKLYMADAGDPTGKFTGIPVVGQGWYTIRDGDAFTGSIAMCNSASALSFRVRLNWLEVSIRSVDWEAPSHVRAWTFPGAEIGLDIVDATTDEVAESMDNTLYGLVQDDGTIGSPYAVSPLTNPACAVQSTVDPNMVLTACLKIKYTGNDFYAGQSSWGPDWALAYGYFGYYPTALPAGEYKYAFHTYGYVERRVFSNVLTLGGGADIQADLIQGGQIRVHFTFLKEHVQVADIQDFNGWVRLEVFDAADTLVGASVYGMADVNPLAPGSYDPYDVTSDYKAACTLYGRCEPAEGAGNDRLTELGTFVNGYGQRAAWSQYFYKHPQFTFTGPNLSNTPSEVQGWYNLDPVNAARLRVPKDKTAAADVFGFYWYYGDKSSRNDGNWANGYDTVSGGSQADTGLRGSSDGAGITGGGLYTVKLWAFDPTNMASYYMAWDLVNVEVPWGGATDLWLNLEQMGRISGSAGYLDMYGNFRAMPWLQVSASGPESVVAYTAPKGVVSLTEEPAYFMWLAPGTYDVSSLASVAPQVFVQTAPLTIEISPGFSASGDIGLAQTGTPIPEFPLAPLVALSALAASLFVLRRRRK